MGSVGRDGGRSRGVGRVSVFRGWVGSEGGRARAECVCLFWICGIKVGSVVVIDNDWCNFVKRREMNALRDRHNIKHFR